MLAGLDVRPEAPRTMLLLHGGGVGPWQWKSQIEAFPEFRVLAPELPGHGDSAGVLPCTIRNCADQVALFLEEKAGPGPVTLIGHSFGAQVALQLLADRPERFDRAAIFSALAIPTPNLYRFGVAPFIGPTVWMLRADWVVRLTARQLRFTDPDSAMALRRSLRSLSRDVLEAIYRENQLFRLPERLSAVHCPTLVVTGRREIGAMRRSVPLIVGAIGTSAQGAILSRADHTFPWSSGALCNEGLRAWMENRPLPSGWIPA